MFINQRWPPPQNKILTLSLEAKWIKNFSQRLQTWFNQKQLMNESDWMVIGGFLTKFVFFCGSITFCFIDIICSPSIWQKDQNLYFIVAQVVKQKWAGHGSLSVIKVRHSNNQRKQMLIKQISNIFVIIWYFMFISERNIYLEKVKTVMVNNFFNINKTNDHLSTQLIEHKKK